MLKVTSRQDILDFEQQPLPELPKSTYEAVSNTARRLPNKVAYRYIFSGVDYKNSIDFTYKQLMGEINRTANMFHDLGIGATDVVSYLLPNLPETVFTIYGAETAGIVNPINPLLEAHHIVDILNAAETKILVTLAPFPKTDTWEKVAQIIPNVPTLEAVLTIDLAAYLNVASRTLVRLTNKKPRTDANVKLLDFNKTRQGYRADKLMFERDIQPHDVSSYFHTGGTTGRPKIAQHTHDNEIFNCWTAFNQLVTDPDTLVGFAALPLFHVNAAVGSLLTTFLIGGTLVMATPAGYRGEGVLPNLWKIVEHYKIGSISVVPTILQYLLNIPRESIDLSSLERIVVGAAPLSVQLFNDFEQATGIQLIEGYGFTEGTCANSLNPIHGERKVGSIGLANAHHHMKIVILDQNKQYIRDAEVDEIGSLVARGRNIFPGYKEAIHNQDIWVDDGTHIWYNSGDLGRMDADSYFWLTGRRKELIIRGGHNIDPKSIEEPLATHPAVAAVAAIPRPDIKVGELPVAYVQLKPGQSATSEELMAHAKAHIGERAAVPKFLVIIPQMPLTAVGKVFKPVLAHQQIKEVFEHDLAAIDAFSSCSVEVIFDTKEGQVANVSVTPNSDMNADQIAALVSKALGRYTVKHRVV